MWEDICGQWIVLVPTDPGSGAGGRAQGVQGAQAQGVVLRAHPIRGESHNQRNTTGKVATVAMHKPLVSEGRESVNASSLQRDFT